jgi:segregation and condensation protein B
MNLESKIEGLLFYKGEDISIKKLSELLSVTVEEVTAALDTLENIENSLKERGIVLVRKDDAVMIGIAPELSPLIQGMRKDEISKELSKASLETLSIILYKDDVTRSEIDYIRGVNSSFIVRNLLVRGLVEKSLDPSDSRRTLYKPTFDTLAYMGVTRAEEIPNYKEVKAQLEGVIHSNTETNG